MMQNEDYETNLQVCFSRSVYV